jgi:hypothetical protein
MIINYVKVPRFLSRDFIIKMKTCTTTYKLLIVLLSFLYFMLSCNKAKKNKSEEEIKDEFVIYEYSVDNLTFSDEFSRNTTVGDTLKIPLLKEASGLAVSRSNPNFFWSHNDSGHPNWLFPVPTSGENHGYVALSGSGARDWEDICIGPGPVNGVNYIYVGDIGDNNAQYNYIIVYRTPELNLNGFTSSSSLTINADDVERFEFEYPDGPVDSETLMIDPWTKDLYIVSKRGYRSTLFRAKAPLNPNKRTVLEKLAQFPFNWAVAGDISSDGHKIAIKTSHKIFYWKRDIGQTVVDALSVKPQLLPYVLEPQGESFGWTPDGNGYFTLSEQGGVYPPNIYYYSKN